MSRRITRAGNMTNTEKVALNIMGVGTTVGFVSFVASPMWFADDAFRDVQSAVLEATMPEDTADIVSIVLAESAAGIVAALLSIFVSMKLRRNTKNRTMNIVSDNVSDAIASGDYFIASAIISSLRVSPPVTPAEIAKTTRLTHEIANNGQMDHTFGILKFRKQKNRKKDAATLEEQNTRDSLVVEIVFDVIKWLVYAVLYTNDGGLLNEPVLPGLESAIFGAISSLVAKGYSDILYSYFGFGGIEKQRKVRSRNASDWLCTYSIEAISGSVLFGVYELVQIPCKAFISAILTAGVEDCTSSVDVKACLLTYELANRPNAAPEAEFRALVTAIASLWHQLPFQGI